MTNPPFKTPWHAQVFALTHALADRGHIAWSDWTAALAGKIAERPVTTSDDYYAAWLDALESLIDAPDTLARLRDAWADAHATTPHGHPVRLSSSVRKDLGKRGGLAPSSDAR